MNNLHINRENIRIQIIFLIIIAAVFFLVGCPCDLLAFDKDTYAGDVMKATFAKRKELVNKQFDLLEQLVINPKKANLAKMRETINEGKEFSDELQNYCKNDSSLLCYDWLKYLNGSIADLELNTAKYLMGKGYKEEAKFYCRDVVITFTGDAYRSYVRQAEFCLEDLKNSTQKSSKRK